MQTTSPRSARRSATRCDQEGFEVTLAVDGEDADGKLSGAEPGYDLLILDIMMPGR